MEIENNRLISKEYQQITNGLAQVEVCNSAEHTVLT